MMISTHKNVWLQPNQICIIQGSATACNLMFENKKDHRLFLQMWDKYLGHMTEVINYHLSPTDWTILFKTKSPKEIIHAYQKQRQKSRKAKLKNTLTAPKRMLSEHIRIFLSQYVRASNRQKKRKGTLVMERFRKYILQSHADFKKIFAFISNQIRFPSQTNTRYQADENQYDQNNEIDAKGILRVGHTVDDKGREEKWGTCGYVMSCLRLRPFKDSVLRKFFDTLQSPPNHLNSS